MILWSKIVLAILGVKLQISGSDNLKTIRSGIIIINHESALDIPITVAVTRIPSRFMAKQELFRIPFFGWLLRISNHIPIDRKNRQKAIRSIEKMSKKLIKRKISIIVSPEGTRSTTGEIAPFKKGAFRLANTHQLPLIPVTILGARYCVPNKSFKIIPGTVDIQIDMPVNITEFPDLDTCIQYIRERMIELKSVYEEKRSGIV